MNGILSLSTAVMTGVGNVPRCNHHTNCYFGMPEHMATYWLRYVSIVAILVCFRFGVHSVSAFLLFGLLLLVALHLFTIHVVVFVVVVV